MGFNSGFKGLKGALLPNLSKMVEGEHFTSEFARLSCIESGGGNWRKTVNNCHAVCHRYTQIVSNKAHVARITHCLLKYVGLRINV